MMHRLAAIGRHSLILACLLTPCVNDARAQEAMPNPQPAQRVQASHTPNAPYENKAATTIEAEGKATIDVAPTYVEFELQMKGEGATLLEATEKATALEPALRQQLQTLELTPTELVFSGMSMPSLEKKEAHLTCRLRLNMRDLLSTADAPRQFASLCDKVATLATATKATVVGPTLGIDDVQTVEDAAVARAVEKAYPRGRAAAQIMNGQIVAVETVNIQYVTWNTKSGPNESQPDLRRLVCTASVRVTYTFAI